MTTVDTKMILKPTKIIINKIKVELLTSLNLSMLLYIFSAMYFFKCVIVACDEHLKQKP